MMKKTSAKMIAKREEKKETMMPKMAEHTAKMETHKQMMEMHKGKMDQHMAKLRAMKGK